MTVVRAAVAATALLFADAPTAAEDRPAGGGPSLAAPTGASTVPSSSEVWVAAHTATALWSDPTWDAQWLANAPQWTIFKVARAEVDGCLYVWDPRSDDYGWVDARDVGPVDPSLAGTALLPPIGARVLWSGEARVSMYTCVELGGCAPTASGLWPEPGMVAVDPRLIPLGSRVWISGLGTFLAADTGGLVRGAHLDVFSLSYQEAIEWGVQRLQVVVFE